MVPYRVLGLVAERELEAGSSVADALSHAARHASASPDTAAPRFVPMHAAPRGEPYESFIARTGLVPVRDDLHDFCNGLVWLRFPSLKRALNRAHAAAIERDGPGARRGAARDALTLFDESGALVDAADDLLAALRAHAWHELFVEHRERWRAEARVTLVGHALLAKLAAPYKSVTAQAWPAGIDPGRAAAGGSPRLAPLPVLGLPGWWPANEDPSFYADVAVFRPPRASRTGAAGR